MNVTMLVPFLVFLLGWSPLAAQRRADSRDLYDRVVCIVPMTGRGTYEDPRRPLFVPPTLTGPEQSRGQGIISFAYQMSDDGLLAVVELVARDRRALLPILNDRRPDIKVFERGKGDAIAVEAEIRKVIRNFDLAKFGARAH